MDGEMAILIVSYVSWNTVHLQMINEVNDMFFNL